MDPHFSDKTATESYANESEYTQDVDDSWANNFRWEENEDDDGIHLDENYEAGEPWLRSRTNPPPRDDRIFESHSIVTPADRLAQHRQELVDMDIRKRDITSEEQLRNLLAQNPALPC
jgi:hypothetical protein